MSFRLSDGDEVDAAVLLLLLLLQLRLWRRRAAIIKADGRGVEYRVGGSVGAGLLALVGGPLCGVACPAVYSDKPCSRLSM